MPYPDAALSPQIRRTFLELRPNLLYPPLIFIRRATTQFSYHTQLQRKSHRVTIMNVLLLRRWEVARHGRSITMLSHYTVSSNRDSEICGGIKSFFLYLRTALGLLGAAAIFDGLLLACPPGNGRWGWGRYSGTKKRNHLKKSNRKLAQTCVWLRLTREPWNKDGKK